MGLRKLERISGSIYRKPVTGNLKHYTHETLAKKYGFAERG